MYPLEATPANLPKLQWTNVRCFFVSHLRNGFAEAHAFLKSWKTHMQDGDVNVLKNGEHKHDPVFSFANQAMTVSVVLKSCLAHCISLKLELSAKVRLWVLKCQISMSKIPMQNRCTHPLSGGVGSKMHFFLKFRPLSFACGCSSCPKPPFSLEVAGACCWQ